MGALSLNYLKEGMCQSYSNHTVMEQAYTYCPLSSNQFLSAGLILDMLLCEHILSHSAVKKLKMLSTYLNNTTPLDHMILRQATMSNRMSNTRLFLVYFEEQLASKREASFNKRRMSKRQTFRKTRYTKYKWKLYLGYLVQRHICEGGLADTCEHGSVKIIHTNCRFLQRIAVYNRYLYCQYYIVGVGKTFS